MSKTVVVGILQNQWAHDPARVQEMLDRNPVQRHKIIQRMLSTSLSGKRLRAGLGAWFERIIWDNASPVVTRKSSSCPGVDGAHVYAVLDKWKPDVVVAFGVAACQCVKALSWDGILLRCPHPASRRRDTVRRIASVADSLNASSRR